MSYEPAMSRYDAMTYRYCGASGLQLPVISLGLWQNFGGHPTDEQRNIVLRAFDRGVTHFDLANNYGPPPGSAEVNFGHLLAGDLSAHRDELVVSSKAGYEMWPGPYGSGGGSRKYVLASLDQSLKRLGLDYVDIFYSHRFDEFTPLDETMAALDQAVRSGRALYVGISSYDAEKTVQAAQIAAELGTPLLIHQPRYNMFDRWIEPEVIDACDREGMGIICFSPLDQGILTDRYLDGVPAGSRAARASSMNPARLDDATMSKVRDLGEIAAARGQTLAQLALAWVLRDERVTSALVGASSVAQLDQNLDTLINLELLDDELEAIDDVLRPATVEGVRDGV